MLKVSNLRIFSDRCTWRFDWSKTKVLKRDLWKTSLEVISCIDLKIQHSLTVIVSTDPAQLDQLCDSGQSHPQTCSRQTSFSAPFPFKVCSRTIGVSDLSHLKPRVHSHSIGPQKKHSRFESIQSAHECLMKAILPPPLLTQPHFPQVLSLILKLWSLRKAHWFHVSGSNEW